MNQSGDDLPRVPPRLSVAGGCSPAVTAGAVAAAISGVAATAASASRITVDAGAWRAVIGTDPWSLKLVDRSTDARLPGRDCDPDRQSPGRRDRDPSQRDWPSGVCVCLTEIAVLDRDRRVGMPGSAFSGPLLTLDAIATIAAGGALLAVASEGL